MRPGTRLLGACGGLWGVGGILVLLGFSVARLTQKASEMFAYDLRWYHWTALVVMVIFMAYSEGYRGFQQAFAPRVVARAKYLYDYPRLLHVLLAPMFCMGYFYIRRRRQVATIVLTCGILVLILLLRFVTQPWRGIVDAGVAVGLTWGFISLSVYSMRALTAAAFPYAPEVPEHATSTRVVEH